MKISIQTFLRLLVILAITVNLIFTILYLACNCNLKNHFLWIPIYTTVFAGLVGVMGLMFLQGYNWIITKKRKSLKGDLLCILFLILSIAILFGCLRTFCG